VRFLLKIGNELLNGFFIGAACVIYTVYFPHPFHNFRLPVPGNSAVTGEGRRGSFINFEEIAGVAQG